MKKIRLAYANTYFQKNHVGGGHVHMEQFVSNAVALGHEIWSWPNNEYPGAHIIPTDFASFIRTMRQMDVLYVRLERKPPNVCKWSLPPYRMLYGFPVVVWEFNTVPEEGLMRGQTEQEVKQAIDTFRRYGRGCDLAICMTKPLGEYVQKNLGIERVLLAPNGSDPDLFRRDIPLVKRMAPFKDQFNVVWIGSANIEYHDFDILRETAQLLWDRGEGSEVIFHIIGPGLKGMGDMPPNVHYWGAEHYKKLPHWLAAMDVGLYITHGGPTYYTAPLKLFDYLASGLTVVSTPQPFIKGLFEELGQSDLLVSPGDPKHLAEILSSLAQDRARVRRLGQAGRQLVIERYNWRKTVTDTFNEIQNILEEQHKRNGG